VIGFLTEVPNVAQAPFSRDFQRGMAESGYVEGKNFATEYRANPESLPQAATDLVRRNVNAIFASGPGAVAAVSKATTSIAVVGIRSSHACQHPQHLVLRVQLGAGCLCRLAK
jgi:putative ABC transport system substrate-binding protein